MQLEFPAKPKGQLQKENDQKFVKIMKETNGKPESNNTVNTNDGKHHRDVIFLPSHCCMHYDKVFKLVCKAI